MKIISSISKVFQSLTKGSGYAEGLRDAITKKDAAKVEALVDAAIQSDEVDDIIPLMRELCIVNWHFKHEDVVSLLQKYGEVADIPLLENVAGKSFPYQAYDESFGLGRKVTWALADIGGKEAREALERIEAGDNSTIAGYARQRLLNWDEESSRKRNRH